MYKRIIKRLFDVVISCLALLVLAIPVLALAIAIKIDDPGPAFFKQKRLGKNGKVFDMLKLRSMIIGAESKGSGVYSGKGDPRVTRVGRFLRATSLDELPQIWNMLRGDMSLIGPRPPLTYHPWPLEQYTAEQRRMFEVRPGLTGWAQVHGRRTVEWNERIRMNVWYVDHCSFLLDCRIFFMTIFKVLRHDDNENTEATVR